uniref:Uncharacterized protein n=1 Tax=Timema bartmani TaxID=61472 RepID=A0A7R9I130_9NEOP|nr:unnamed protein product [Timema bartmani]
MCLSEGSETLLRLDLLEGQEESKMTVASCGLMTNGNHRQFDRTVDVHLKDTCDVKEARGHSRQSFHNIGWRRKFCYDDWYIRVVILINGSFVRYTQCVENVFCSNLTMPIHEHTKERVVILGNMTAKAVWSTVKVLIGPRPGAPTDIFFLQMKEDFFFLCLWLMMSWTSSSSLEISHSPGDSTAALGSGGPRLVDHPSVKVAAGPIVADQELHADRISTFDVYPNNFYSSITKTTVKCESVDNTHKFSHVGGAGLWSWGPPCLVARCHNAPVKVVVMKDGNLLLRCERQWLICVDLGASPDYESRAPPPPATVGTILFPSPPSNSPSYSLSWGIPRLLKPSPTSPTTVGTVLLPSPPPNNPSYSL